MKLKADVCVIGAGSGGLAVASGAAKLGAKVVLIESDKMGGDCLHYSCVPSKSLLAAAHLAERIRQADQFGIQVSEPDIHYARVGEHIRRVIAAIEPRDSKAHFNELGVTVIQSEAQFIDAKTVRTDEAEITARYFVIATGSSPAIPAIPGLEDVYYLTNENIFDLDTQPEHLVIIGGGSMACELAQAHRLLGTKVTLFEAQVILPKDDVELVWHVRQKLINDGVDLRENSRINRVSADEQGIRIEFEQNSHAEYVVGSHLLIAAGRKAHVQGLHLEVADVRYHSTGIEVNDHLRTSNRRIYAVGDVVGTYPFTHVAHYQASIVLQNMLLKFPVKAHYHAVPWVTYVSPELAHVGLTEEQAHQARLPIRVLRYDLKENDRAQMEYEASGLIKVIVSKRGQILGASILAPHAGELILPWVMAVQQRQSIKVFAKTMAPYPTLSDISQKVAQRYDESWLSSRWVRWWVKFT